MSQRIPGARGLRIPDSLDGNARVAVRTTVSGPFKRRQIQVIAGSGISVGLADDSGGEEVEVTIAASRATVQKATSYEVTSADEDIDVDATNGTVTLTLPDASTVPSREFTAKKIDATFNGLVLAGAGGQLIDGLATRILRFQWNAIRVKAIGSAWRILVAT